MADYMDFSVSGATNQVESHVQESQITIIN